MGRHRALLEQLPAELWPQTPIHGEHSYTLRSRSGARVEVLLRSRAFFIKSTSPGIQRAGGPYVPWSRLGAPATTWMALKAEVGYE